MINENFSAKLSELEDMLLEHQINDGSKPYFSDWDLLAVNNLFISVLLDKMWDLQEQEKISFEDRENMAVSAGKEINKLIKTYTNIDVSKLIKKCKINSQQQ